MSFIDPLYPVFLATGFAVGFGHCIGMCGPIVVSLSLNLKDKNLLIPHLLYNSGRVVTYGVLGGVMGATGSFTLVAAHIAEIQKGAMIFAGVLIIIMGLAMSGWISFGQVFGNSYNPGGFISKGFRRLSQIKSPAAYFPIGLLLGLLPCGPVYTALLAAAGAGMEAAGTLEAIIKGMGVMICFGLGTVPALFLVAKLADMGWLKKREIIYRIGAVLMVAVGIYFIIKGIRY
ncbi:MAG: sulfite exporter TauE/SafE family protein [Deltaproteobacteria bacterium]|nr:sulfite exporter TauE/SafE family protein [Deltaproteobacteria bacterium]